MCVSLRRGVFVEVSGTSERFAEVLRARRHCRLLGQSRAFGT